MKLVLGHHPQLGDLRDGDCVVLNNTVARLCGGGTENIIHYQAFKEPKIFEHCLPEYRPLKSFASNELLLDTRLHAGELSQIEARVQVLSLDQVASQHNRQTPWYLYRQVVENGSVLEPELAAKVHEANKSFSVENPEKMYFYCQCTKDAVLYVSDQNRAYIGDLVSGYTEFTCRSCQDRREDPIQPPREEWKLRDLPKPEDPKRVVVIDKFTQGIAQDREFDEGMMLKSENDVEKYAIQLEDQIHGMFTDKPREFKARVYTLTFNIGKNQSLRRRICAGEVSPIELANATPDQLASDELAEKRKEQRDKYFMTEVVKRADEARVNRQESEMVNDEAHVKKQRVEVTQDQQRSPENVEKKPEQTHSDSVEQIASPHADRYAVSSEPSPKDEPMPPPSDMDHVDFDVFSAEVKESVMIIESDSLRGNALGLIDYYLKHRII